MLASPSLSQRNRVRWHAIDLSREARPRYAPLSLRRSQASASEGAGVLCGVETRNYFLGEEDLQRNVSKSFSAPALQAARRGLELRKDPSEGVGFWFNTILGSRDNVVESIPFDPEALKVKAQAAMRTGYAIEHKRAVVQSSSSQAPENAVRVVRVRDRSA